MWLDLKDGLSDCYHCDDGDNGCQLVATVGFCILVLVYLVGRGFYRYRKGDFNKLDLVLVIGHVISFAYALSCLGRHFAYIDTKESCYALQYFAMDTWFFYRCILAMFYAQRFYHLPSAIIPARATQCGILLCRFNISVVLGMIVAAHFETKIAYIKPGVCTITYPSWWLFWIWIIMYYVEISYLLLLVYILRQYLSISKISVDIQEGSKYSLQSSATSTYRKLKKLLWRNAVVCIINLTTTILVIESVKTNGHSGLGLIILVVEITITNVILYFVFGNWRSRLFFSFGCKCTCLKKREDRGISFTDDLQSGYEVL